MHNLAHIELNAIDLAWDTVVRFSYASEELGRQFFADFLHVADDESRHFRWCQQRLNELGFRCVEFRFKFIRISNFSHFTCNVCEQDDLPLVTVNSCLHIRRNIQLIQTFIAIFNDQRSLQSMFAGKHSIDSWRMIKSGLQTAHLGFF